MHTYKVGIVGLGVVGQRLISQFQNSTNIQIASLCDTNLEILNNTAKIMKNVNVYTNYQEMFSKEELDFVYIAVPPAYHHPVVMAAAQHDLHILCEKPLANSIEEAEQMLSVVQEKNLVNGIHFPMAYEKAFATINKMMTDEAFGELKRITLKMHFPEWPRPWQKTSWISSRLQGGFIREISPHYLHLIMHFFGDVKRVITSVEFPDDPNVCEEGVLAILELENGRKVLVDGMSGQAEKEEIAFTIHGTEKSFRLENWRTVKTAAKGEAWTIVDEAHLAPAKFDLIQEFVKSLNGEDAHLVNFKDGLNIQYTLEQLLGHQ
ncbi:Putative 4,5-dihydroxyphthalate dehydrogenase [Bacillus sp. THAF10]|uniref:Gfo/Idh/MocA family protein n=1 Tax=Bacillus sp. THAF10 TaxID=2587848 RepID=UPI00126888C9|nr:Gfo/Idh/MocA family oxidoreductase [Bacillus sp. THAF10]QFT89153.1 Putative 4,5-dihydroxyphthalate dehydrogenase [Bacillus sp. THAF10]